MSTEEKNSELVKEHLKKAHNQIQPPDSWDALRKRIDDKIDNRTENTVKLGGSAVFWQRAALALAACFVLTSAFLIYTLCKTSDNSQTDAGLLLSSGQVAQLSIVFSNVRELFGSQTPWMVVDSSGKGEIGVDILSEDNANTEKVIVLRLAVNTPDKQQYYDVVALASQQVNFNMPQIDYPDMNVSLRPEITSGGKINISINVMHHNEQANQTVTIADNRFTSLVRMTCDNKLITIDAAGQLASSI